MSKNNPGSKRKPERIRATKKITKDEKAGMKRLSRKRAPVKRTPALDVSIPVAHAGDGYRVAETFLEKNGAGILDIVVPKGTEVEAWCAYGRPARGKNRPWVVVSNHPDANGRFVVPVPRTQFYVWGFGEVPAEAESGESVWRLHGHNVSMARTGREVCLRIILRLTPIALPVPRGSKRRLSEATRSKSEPRATRSPPVRVPA